MNNKVTRFICINAVIAALYAVLTILCVYSYGPFQIRPSEALTILPCLYPPAAIGLAIGCAIANIASTYGIWDVIIGSLITLIAALISGRIKNPFIAAIPPVVLNALCLPAMMIIAGETEAYYIIALSILLTQAVMIYGLGIPLYYGVKKFFIRRIAGA